MAKKKSTCTGVVGGDEKKPLSSSSSATAAKRKKGKKRMVTKCHICLHCFTPRNLDKHMHSRTHHEAIERLTGGEQMHQCWACDVSVSGLEQFSKHIECEEHNSKVLILKQRRERGFRPDYNNEELNVLSAQRDHKRSLLKKQKLEEKLNKMKERKAEKWMKAFGWSAACQSKNEEKQRTMKSGTVPKSTQEGVTRTEARCWWTAKSFAQTDIISSQEEDKSHQSGEQEKVRLEKKRSCDVNTSAFPSVKKRCLGNVSSTNSKLSSSHLRQDHMSRILTNICLSPAEEHLNSRFSEDPDLKTMLSDIPPSSSEPPQSQKTCQIKRTSSPCKQEDNLPTSTQTHPQEKVGPTQDPGTRQVLPTLLSRSVSKTETSKPNLKTARGIRTAQKPGQDAKTRVLKPALQKLISSKSSQWRVNWKEMYEEATHRKLQKEKGMPRFGIELVTRLPPDPQEDDLELDEGFQWASIECEAITPPGFKEDTEGQDYRSLSTNHTSWLEKKNNVEENSGSSRTSRSSKSVPDKLSNVSETQASGTQALESVVCVKTEKSNEYLSKPTLQKSERDGLQSIPKTQIQQEVQDFPHTDINNLPKSQVNDLLVMSLREVELWSSLEDVDTRLLRAQAVLQTALLEVQRLQMIKQQVTAEMSSFRNKRINILKKIKNSGLDQSP